MPKARFEKHKIVLLLFSMDILTSYCVGFQKIKWFWDEKTSTVCNMLGPFWPLLREHRSGWRLKCSNRNHNFFHNLAIISWFTASPVHTTKPQTKQIVHAMCYLRIQEKGITVNFCAIQMIEGLSMVVISRTLWECLPHQIKLSSACAVLTSISKRLKAWRAGHSLK